MRQVGHSGSHTPGLDIGSNGGSDKGLSDMPARRDGQLGRDQAGLGDSLRRDMRFNQFGFGEDARERESAFQDKVARALRDATRVDGFAEERDRSRLIASANAEGLPQPQVQTAAVPAGDADASRADQVVCIDTLSDRIEAAVQAEMRTGRPGTFALRLDLGSDGIGLSSVTISFSPEGLDIVLASDGSAGSAETLAAAQALADRLGQRFSRRTVRVFEAPRAEAEALRDGMSEISSLFRQTGPRS